MEDQEQTVSMPDNTVGEVKISTEVVITIAHTATLETEGISGMSVGIADNISQVVLGRKGGSKGIRVELTEKDVNIDLFVVVDYGARIPDVAWRVQEKVKTAIETITAPRSVIFSASPSRTPLAPFLRMMNKESTINHAIKKSAKYASFPFIGVIATISTEVSAEIKTESAVIARSIRDAAQGLVCFTCVVDILST